MYGQKPTELVSPPKLIVPKSEGERPKLRNRKKITLLTEDYFKPDIDLPNLNNKKSKLMFGEMKIFDPGKRYENKLIVSLKKTKIQINFKQINI